MTARFNHRWSVLALALGLAACGGGGSDSGGGGGGTTTYTLSGTISVVETSAVDSDLNDPNQSGYKLNHNPANSIVPDDTSAQAISTPILLTGTVNQAGFGPSGNNYAAGDTDDYFKVDLAAGQVVELEFAADVTDNANDIDLFVFDATGSYAGGSDAIDTRYECIRITRPGTYYVNVYAARGASIYSLRIGAPGTGGNCDNTATAFGTTALLAKPHGDGSAQALTAKAASAHQTLLGRAGVRQEAPAGIGPHRLHLPGTTAARRAGLDALAGRNGSAAAASAKAVASTGGSADVSTLSADSAGARIAAMATTLRYAKALRATGAYAYVEPDWVMQHTATIGSFPPDDRYYSYQKWHYEQIQLPAAINRIVALGSQPTRRPVVAVIDSGVVLDHPDIAPQLASNGRSFVGGVSTASGDDISTSQDSVFHGTHVAGTIAASTYDGAGVAGVAPMAQILPLNVFGNKSGASTSDIVNAIKYAAGLDTSPAGPRRADVINMSLGGGGTCSNSFGTVIAAAREAGVIVVAAAGNENVSTVGQPANCSGVIAVGATQADKTRAPYSNTGSAMKVAAPGGNTGVSTTGNGQPDGIFSTMASVTSAGKRLPTLGYLQGTSMASPHVAGVMALMRYVNPSITPAQIDALLSSPTPSITDDLGSTGWDSTFGYGLINADKAVTEAISITGTKPPSPAGQVVASPASLDFGSFQTSAVLSLAYSGTSSETVTSVTPSNAAMRITPQASVGSNGLGPYTVTVDRSKLSSSSTYLTITVTLSTGRSFVIPVAVSKAGSVARSGGFGPVYLLLTDSATGEVLKQVTATATSTGYTWSASGMAAGSYGIIAGTDLDNDGYICQRGEACGGYPVIEAVIDGQGVEVGGNRSDLNFQIAPLSGISALSSGSRTSQGFRRMNRQP